MAVFFFSGPSQSTWGHKSERAWILCIICVFLVRIWSFGLCRQQKKFQYQKKIGAPYLHETMAISYFNPN